MSLSLAIERTLSDPERIERGGVHGQIGVDFQRFWILKKILELHIQSDNDYVVVIEGIQDVLVFDSAFNPTFVNAYQIKKKDSGEWGISELFGFSKKDIRSKVCSEEVKSKFKKSPIFKMIDSISLMDYKSVRCDFVSNAGFSVKKNDNSTSISKSGSCLVDIDDEILDFLKNIITSESQSLDYIKSIHLSWTDLPVDSTDIFVTGLVANFADTKFSGLNFKNKTFIDAMFMSISMRCKRIPSSNSFEDLCKTKGFDRNEISKNIASCVSSSLDRNDYVSHIVDSLRSEGAQFDFITSIRINISKILTNSLAGFEMDGIIYDKCRYIVNNMKAVRLKDFLEKNSQDLMIEHNDMEQGYICSIICYFLIQKWENQTL